MARTPQSANSPPQEANANANGGCANGGGLGASTKSTKARRYGFACANCGEHKAKCDGGMLSWERCLASGETCYFDK